MLCVFFLRLNMQNIFSCVGYAEFLFFYETTATTKWQQNYKHFLCLWLLSKIISRFHGLLKLGAEQQKYLTKNVC